MILLLSGEGPGDLGSCDPAADHCEGAGFRPGPMAALIDRLVEAVWQYSPLDAQALVLIPKSTLVAESKKQGRAPVLPGLKRPPGGAYFYKNARELGRLALEWSQREKCAVGAILFRDSDGVASDPATLWEDKVKSMEAGFIAAGFWFGVPMVPKPKSEAWLLCALQSGPQQNCSRFEARSGNDSSPNSLKKELTGTLDHRGIKYTNLAEMILQGTLDLSDTQMSSFQVFRGRLRLVAESLRSQSVDGPQAETQV